jgi:hypothetical protein
MMSSITHQRGLLRTAAATLAAFALAAPAAVAMPIDGPPTRPPTTEPDRSAPPPVTTRASDESFDWGAAGIGAAATGGLVLVAAGGFAAAHRARTRLAP